MPRIGAVKAEPGGVVEPLHVAHLSERQVVCLKPRSLDLTDIDRQMFVTNHTVLYGRLQDFAQRTDMAGFDTWLAQNGLPQTTPYVRSGNGGATTSKKTTLPTAVRHMIHHPENGHNTLTDEDLRDSVELLLELVQRLPSQGLLSAS